MTTIIITKTPRIDGVDDEISRQFVGLVINNAILENDTAVIATTHITTELSKKHSIMARDIIAVLALKVPNFTLQPHEYQIIR